MAKTILVVEDDPDMREWISLHLRNAGYTVRSVENGFKAAGACLQKKPDLVSATCTPGMGGLDMIKVLNTEGGLKDIPVIFFTADTARRERSTALGAVEYLTKPIAPEALVAAVAQHLVS